MWFNRFVLLSHALEERVAEDAVCLSRSVKISNPCIKGFAIDDIGLNRGFTNTLNHRGERLPGKAVDEVGSARIDIHHAWRDVNCFQTCLDHKWIELPANQRIASRQPLQLDQTLDCHSGCAAIGVEVSRSVVTLDDGHGATSFEQPLENRQRL